MRSPTSPNPKSPLTLVKVQLTHSKLKYCEEVKRYSIRGEISPARRSLLDTFRSQLGLTLEEATEIEDQVLRLLREDLEDLQHYQAAFIAEIRQEYPLSQESLVVLEKLQDVLGLRKEDVIPVEKKAIAGKENLERLKAQATEKGLVIQRLRQKIAPIENQLIDEIDLDLHPAIDWLSSQKHTLIERACREVQKDGNQLSEEELNDFSFQLGQYLNLIQRAIVAQSDNLLQEPRLPLLPNVSLYTKALEFVKTRIPPEMNDVELILAFSRVRS